MTEQLTFDFSVSSTQRNRRAAKLADGDDQPTLFASWSPDIDVQLHSPDEAIAQITGSEPERAHHWLAAVVGQIRVIKTRRIAFPTEKLDRLLSLRPPAQVTLDAASSAVARAIWAHKLGLKPLKVTRVGQRLLAVSPRWPVGLRIKDAPWTTIATLTQLGVPLEVADSARVLFARRLAEAGATIATAGLAGSAVLIKTARPELIENMGLPGLAYSGDPGSGTYKLPLLSAAPLLKQPLISVPGELARAIRAATDDVKPLAQKRLGKAFPWKLFDFQATDAGQALRILEITGGALLAGDMGSGKTTISLALVQVMDTWPILVVAPLSAFSTWERQLGEMGRSTYLAVGSPKKAWEIIESGEHEAVVISYDRLPAFVELIERMHFRALVADEIQRIRTPNSKRSRALRTLSASIPTRIGLSGTPVTNTLADILAVGAALAPGEWRPRANSKDLADMYPGDPVEGIAEHLGSMMVRRRIDQVGREMPARNDHRVYVAMTPEQRRAIADLEAEAQTAKESGEFDGPNGKFNALVKLGRMRKIIANPKSAGVPGPNPKIEHAVRLIKRFYAEGRKGVVFTVDRASFSDLGEELDREGIRWGGIWGSTPARERIEVEKRLHRGELDVVLCTVAAGAESWTASPTATYCLFLSYVWAPASLAQAEARVYRLNSDLNGPSIEILYLHATGVGGATLGGEPGQDAPQGSVDDRMVEVLEAKKALFAQVVDRTVHKDTTNVHAKLSDLLFVLTGQKDETLAMREADAAKSLDRERARKKHAKESLYAHKARNRNDASLGRDDGSQALTLEEHHAAERVDADVSALLEDLDYTEDDLELDLETFAPDTIAA